MARPLLHQGPCGWVQGRQVATRRILLSIPSAGVCTHAAPRPTTLATQPVDVEQETCSTSSRSAQLVTQERPVGAISTADAPSCSGFERLGSRAAIVAVASGISLLLVDAAWANSEALSGGALDLFKDFLDQVEAMGPAGGLVFVAMVMLSEMIPLFPTQPLSLASGLLFGGKQGALLMLIGVTMAAINAFIISRGVGRPLAEKIISMEMGEESEDSPSGAAHNAVARKLAEVQRTIETGTFWQQLIAVALLRLTPVVPFSASNYVLGLTPLQLPAFIGGTVAGMSVWSVLYASLGGAGRILLDSGEDIGTVIADMADQSGAYTRPALLVGGGLAAVAAVIYLINRQMGAGSGDGGGGGDGGAPTGSSGNGAGSAPKAADSAAGARSLLLKEQQLLRK